MGQAALQIETKVCEACTSELPLVSFYPHPKGGWICLCRPCTVEDNKLRRQDPERHRQVMLARREARKQRKCAGVVEKACTKCGDVKPLDAFRVHRGLYGRSSWCMECEHTYKAAYEAENRDVINSRKRETWAATERTPDQRQDARRRASRWYTANKGRRSATLKLWLSKNRAAFRVIQQRRRARLAGVSATLTTAEWLGVLELFGRRCAYCLRENVPLTMDHMIPIARGGSHTVDNVVPACKHCNCTKKDRPIFSMLNRQHADVGEYHA